MRMVNEGHVVTNHTVRHPALPDLSDEDIIWQLTHLEDRFRELTGHETDKFMRPPSGEYSPRVLGLTQELGFEFKSLYELE